MNTDTTPAELDVLTDEEMASVVGGAEAINVQEFVYNGLGMCSCGGRH